MRKLNKQFRKKNKTTNVLSFSEIEVPFEKFKIGRPVKHKGLGEIVICLREVKKNAKKLGIEFQDEFTKTIIHGVLHLLGYDHEKSAEQKQKMENKENLYFNEIKI